MPFPQSLVRKKSNGSTRGRKSSENIFTCIDTYYTRTWRADRQTPHDGKPRLQPGYAEVGAAKNHDFRPSRFISETIQDRAVVAMEDECDLSNVAISNYLE